MEYVQIVMIELTNVFSQHQQYINSMFSMKIYLGFWLLLKNYKRRIEKRKIVKICPTSEKELYYDVFIW